MGISLHRQRPPHLGVGARVGVEDHCGHSLDGGGQRPVEIDEVYIGGKAGGTAWASTSTTRLTSTARRANWALLKRGYHDTYHRMRPAHLQRYIDEFAGRYNQRPLDTEFQMRMMAQGTVGKCLHYRDLEVGEEHGMLGGAQ